MNNLASTLKTNHIAFDRTRNKAYKPLLIPANIAQFPDEQAEYQTFSQDNKLVQMEHGEYRVMTELYWRHLTNIDRKLVAIVKPYWVGFPRILTPQAFKDIWHGAATGAKALFDNANSNEEGFESTASAISELLVEQVAIMAAKLTANKVVNFPDSQMTFREWCLENLRHTTYTKKVLDIVVDENPSLHTIPLEVIDQPELKRAIELKKVILQYYKTPWELGEMASGDQWFPCRRLVRSMPTPPKPNKEKITNE